MKINKYYKQQVLVVSTLLLLLNTSCNDFLNNVAPQGQEASTVFMEEQANAELAVAGMYNMLAFCRGSGPDGDWVDNHFDSYFGSMIYVSIDTDISFKQILLYTWLLGCFSCQFCFG